MTPPRPYVLLAEADAAARELVRAALIGLGCEVRVAEDGHELVELYRTSRPHLVLTGTALPRLDGFAACRRIRETEKSRLRPRTPVHFLPAEGSITDEKAASAHGGDGFLPRPFRREDLERALDAAMKGRGA